MQRVAVIGSGGAGKSVFSRELGDRTGLPVVHLDRLFWKPSWTPRPEDEWAGIVRTEVAGERWILDGNYSGTMDARFARADTVVFLDIPMLVCLGSVIRRWARYRRETRPDMGPGNHESLDPKFLAWIINFPRTKRPKILRRLDALPPSTQVVRLRSRRAMRAFLDAVPTTRAVAA